MSSQPAASPEPARVVVLGAGWWTQGWHCPHLSRHPHAIIAAVVDTSPTPRSAISELESLEALGARYGCPTFSSFDAVLEASVARRRRGTRRRPDRYPPSRRRGDTRRSQVFDGVIVCTSHASHAALGQRALAAGKHVLMEKPMTTDVAEARALAAAAAARPELFFAVNNTASWRPQAHAAAAWVKAGSVGRVRHVACVMHSPLLWLFDDPANVGRTGRAAFDMPVVLLRPSRRTMPARQRRKNCRRRTSYIVRRWTKPTGSMRGNGFAWGQLSHLLAWVLQVTGLEPAKVSCTMTRARRVAEIRRWTPVGISASSRAAAPPR